MEERKGKIHANKSGGNASKNSHTYRATIPNTWFAKLGLTLEDRDIKLTLTDDNKIIIEKA